MTLIDKIKKSVEGATGLPFLYHAAGEINELIARCQSLPVAYSFLIDSGTIDDVNGRYHERVTLAVMFCDKTEFDFNALENEEIIDRMKEKAYKWMSSLRMSNTLNVVSVNNTQRLYDTTTDILTGFAVNITIEDVAGVGECELPQVVIDVKKNGSYDVVGVDKVRVNVLQKLEDLEVTQNGEYLPPTDIDGFRKVSVNVQPTLEELTITENGTYTPQDGVDGFSKVVSNVVTTKKVKIGKCGSNFLNDNCINSEGIWEDADLIDFSECTSMDSMFMYGASRLKELDVTNWDTRKVTSFRYWFRYGGDIERIIGKLNVSAATEMYEMIWNTQKLEEFDVSDWKFNSNLKCLPAFFQCYSLKMLDVSNWNVENITEFGFAFNRIAYQSEIIIDVSKWDVSNAVSLYGMFGSETGIRVLDFRNWDISNVTDIAGFLGGYGTRYNILESLIGGETIESVLNSNIAALKNLKISLHLADNKLLDRASLRAVINGLADLTGQTAQTLTLGATLRAKLTEEDIAVATNKNWTIV